MHECIGLRAGPSGVGKIKESVADHGAYVLGDLTTNIDANLWYHGEFIAVMLPRHRQDAAWQSLAGNKRGAVDIDGLAIAAQGRLPKDIHEVFAVMVFHL
ncbi:MAG TPA: hypothetical protein VE988_01060, partial [Gemmataceae bacterium]|nr:hypothetical protein [Gemmataceae bacterium]